MLEFIEILLCNFRKKKSSKALSAPLEFNRSISVPDKGLKTKLIPNDQENINEIPSKRVLKIDRYLNKVIFIYSNIIPFNIDLLLIN